MQGLWLGYAIAGLITSVPAIASAVILLVLAGRTARERPARPAWAAVAGAAALLGVAAAFAVLVTPDDGTGSVPAWVVPLDVVGVVAAVGAAVSRQISTRRHAALRWMGPMAGVGIFIGALLGFFVLPAIEPIGAALSDVRCTSDPWCQTEEEATAAAQIDGTATLSISGSAVGDAVVAGARCEHDAPEDGFRVTATFNEVDPPIDVELSVMEDGSYRMFALHAGGLVAFPGKSFDPTTAVRIAEGTTPVAGRIVFKDLGALGPDGEEASGATFSGEVLWKCPGFQTGD